MNIQLITLILVAIITVWLLIHSILNFVNKPDKFGGIFKGGAPPGWLLNLGRFDLKNIENYFGGVLDNLPECVAPFEASMNKITNNLFGSYSNYTLTKSQKEVEMDDLVAFEYTLTPKNRTNGLTWKLLPLKNDRYANVRPNIRIGLVVNGQTFTLC